MKMHTRINNFKKKIASNLEKEELKIKITRSNLYDPHSDGIINFPCLQSLSQCELLI